MFPEIDYDKIDTVRGMDITIVTTAQTDDQGRALLARAGLPVPPRRAAGVRPHGEEGTRATSSSAKPKFKVRGYTRCRRCGRAALGVPRLRALPHLLARDGARRRGSRHDEGVVVRGVAATMTMTDPIADMLTRIRNANIAFHDDVVMPSSKLKEAVAPDPRARGLHHRLRGRRPSRPSGPAAHDHDEVHDRSPPHDLGI